MSVQYQGKSPGKVWKIWQKTKALAHTPFEYSTATQAKEGAKNTGFSAGTMVGYGLINTHLLPLLPIPGVGLALMVVSGIALGYFGTKAYRNIKSVTGSSYVSSYVRKQETKWLEKQQKRNAPKTSAKPANGNSKGSLLDKLPLPLVKAGKWIGYAAAAVGAAVATGGALHYAGVAAFSTSAAATTVVGAVAHVAAVVGLTATAAIATVTGLAALAIPVGIAAAFWCRGNAYARNPARSIFKSSTGAPKPISQGEVFKPKAAAFDLTPTAGPSEAFNDQQSKERQKAAEARAAARANKSNGGPRFQ